MENSRKDGSPSEIDNEIAEYSIRENVFYITLVAARLMQEQKLKDVPSIELMPVVIQLAERFGIGTVKLPCWICDHAKAEPDFAFSSGGGFPDDLSGFKVIVHCGGCMLNSREMLYRERAACQTGRPHDQLWRGHQPYAGRSSTDGGMDTAVGK